MKIIIDKNNIGQEIIDYRVGSKCYYIQIPIKDYLEMVDLKANPYQRNLLNIKLYKKLIFDVLEGAVFPPISVVYPDKIILEEGFDSDKKFKILDGLQRTNCLYLCKDIISDKENYLKDFPNIKINYKDIQEFLDKKITLEVWENLNLRAILYKIIVLNTGQRRMDTRHQLDILFYSLQETLTKKGIKVTRYIETLEQEMTSKDLYNQNIFPLSSIAESLVSYMIRMPSYSQKDAADILFETLSLGENEFENLLKSTESEETYLDLYWVLKDLSDKLIDKYKYNILIKYGLFLSGVFAAMGLARKNMDPKQFEEKKDILIKIFDGNEDPLKLGEFQIYYKKFESGIGVKRRKLVYNAFRNFFLNKYIHEINWREAYEEIETRL